ncbi:MAG: hypothetical protein AB8I08_25065 [Sandaracinaceae bacterium]
MKKHLRLTLALGLMNLGLVAGCSSADSASLDPATSGPTGSRTVTQGGAQDIGYFRSLVADGDVPTPDTLEPVGFFAEHAIDLPDADCGDQVCVHSMLAVAPGIDQVSNWTMAFVALNTPVDAQSLERPETHVVLAIEDTARASITAERSNHMIRAFANELVAGDRLSIVRIGDEAEILASGVTPTDPALAAAAAGFTGASSRAALYDGLARSAQAIEDIEDFTGAHRVVLVTSGAADAGITDSMRVVGLGDALAREGVGVSVVGVGESYRPEIAAQISEGGGGSYYFAESADDLVDIFTLEARTSLFPLATDFELRVEAAAGYTIGRVYGARRARSEQAAATLESPVLMVGNRTGATDVEEGRRGGGGGLFVELLADAALGEEIGANAPAFVATASWTDPTTGERVTQSATVDNGLAPGENPTGMFPHFSDPARGKAFMMLNMYLSLRTTAELYHEGSCGQARGVLPAMQLTYEGWQAEYADPDIDADWALLSALEDNLQQSCAGTEPVAPVFSFGCFYD